MAFLNSTSSCELLSKEVSLKCFRTMMGVGQGRVERAKVTRPDLRFGKDKTGSRRTSASVDAFLQILYDSVAETLPHQPRGA